MANCQRTLESACLPARLPACLCTAGQRAQYDDDDDDNDDEDEEEEEAVGDEGTKRETAVRGKRGSEQANE